MNKIMFDSNVFDKLPSFIEKIHGSSSEYDYYVTTIQVDELCEIPDSKLEIRKQNILMLADLRARLVPTSVCILNGRARFGYTRLGEGVVYKKILNETKSNIDDAIIADCIFRKNCASVPEERSAIPLETEQSSAS